MTSVNILNISIMKFVTRFLGPGHRPAYIYNRPVRIAALSQGGRRCRRAMIQHALCVLLCLGLVSAADLLFKQKLPRDCQYYHKLGYTKPGYFKIYLTDNTATQIYCEHTLNSTSIVILRRIRGDTTFYRKWSDYEYGFGNVQSDMWAGLKTISSLTLQGYRRLTIQTQDWAGNQRQAVYDYFFVSGSSDRYRMSVSHFIAAQSTLADDLSHNNLMQFATYDRPDIHNCSVNMMGGWWYNYCTFVLPTGHYYSGGHYTPSGKFYDGIFYKDYLGFGYSLKYISMILTTL